jgi:formylglycine-generating enzyme required for sulfatase activity
MAVAAASAQDDWWHETVLVSLREEHYCPEFFRAMLKEGIAERQPDFADRCLNEAKYFFHEPFLEALNDPNTPPERVAAVLRMLRGKSDRIPELGEVVRQVVGQRFLGTDETGKQIRGYAQEILAHSGGTLLDEPTGQVRVDSRTGITWVAIPPGEFLMGGDQDDDERPIHRVKIKQGFWLAKYPVTNQQYGLFLESLKGQVEAPRYWDDRRFNQPEQPVVGVSWHDAQQYCEWAGCRLPTEAEWEYCCRATSQGEYCFGDDPRMLGEYGWFRENSGGQTQPVGTKRANTWGLHDMHGNVWEWCQDWYSSDYYEESPMEDPKGPLQATRRVFRGGGWSGEAAYCRSAFRDWHEPDIRSHYLGFRAALSSEPVQMRSQPRKPRRGRRR